MCFTKSLSATEFAVLIKQLFDIFLQLRIKQTINRSVGLEFLRMDIKLLKEGNGYSVQISNCGKWKTEHYHKILSILPEFCAKLILKSEESLFHGEVVYKNDQASLKNSDEEEDANEFPYLKEYLSVKLKPTINVCNLRAFEELLLKEISSLKNLSPEVKFTYFRDSEMLYNNRVELDKDYKSCCLVSSAMCKVVKQSLREEFQRESFQLFGVSNFEDLDFAIKSILLPKIHSNYVRMTVQILRDFKGAEKYF